MNHSMELLAPAGGMRELKAAIASGADAVYMGASSFSARSGAENFKENEMRDAVEYAHIYGVKVHCAINTLIKEDELPSAVDTAITANKCGVDAIIIQDLGLARHLKKLLPDIELHASTQMTVTSLLGVRYLENIGFSRVVLARELSLPEIEYIAKNAKAEIEVFVHGAICMSYSGQCLMSSILGGRSGNRGRCAQPCRLPYTLTENGKVCDNGYILSPKDMALINHLDELKKAGVSSLKIEGRLKSAEYVSAVTGIYRKYLDNPQKVLSEDIRELKNAFSRSGFTDGYLTGKLGKDMISHKNPANNSGSTFTDEAKKRAEGKSRKKIPIDIYVSLIERDVLRVTGFIKDNICVASCGSQKAEKAINRPLDEDRLKEQISKLGDTPFCVSAITVDIDDEITVPIKEINEVRRSMCERLQSELSKREEKRILDIPLSFGKNIADKEMYLSAEVSSKEQGMAIIKNGGVKRIYAPNDVAKELIKEKNHIEIVSRTADILTDEDIATEYVSISSPAAMVKYKDKAKYGEWRLNIYNSYTADMFSGLSCVTISPELNLRDIKSVVSHIEKTQTEIIGYGHIPLMIMKNCPIKAMGRCQNGNNIYKLRDRKGMEFPLICTKGCKSVLLNSKPVYTADMIDEIKDTKVNCIRLNFTVENPSDCVKIVNMYRSALDGKKQPSMPENTFTRGHLKRGV